MAFGDLTSRAFDHLRNPSIDADDWNESLTAMERIAQRMASQIYVETVPGEQRDALQKSLARLVKRIEDTRL